MNGIDIAILSIMGVSCLMGLLRGVTKEVLGLFTWAGSIAAAYYTYPMAASIARGHIANPMIADVITGVVLFIVFLIIFSIITVNISNSVRDSMMGGIDRSLGLAFGIVRGVVVLCIVEIIFSLFIVRQNQSHSIQNARFTPMIRNGADQLMGMIPLSLKELLEEQTKKIQATSHVATKSAETLPPVLPGGVSPVPHQPGTLDQPSTPEGHQSVVPPTTLDHSTGRATDPIAAPTQPTQQTKHAPTPTPAGASMDPEKTVEALANLKPQAAQTKATDGTYDKRQQRALDRLLDTSE